MNDKFTIRDFLVYFTTGAFLIITIGIYVFFNYSDSTFFSDHSLIKDSSSLIIFILIPFLYIIGHIIHGIDLIVFKVGRLIWDAKNKYKDGLKKFKFYWLFTLLNFIVNGNRILGILNSRSINSHDFWKLCSDLQMNSKYDKAEYWALLNDLLKGLTIASCIWMFYFLFTFKIKLLLCSFVLCSIFWYRARHSAINFITTIRYKESVTL